MKLKKRLIGAGLTLAAAVLLTACGQSASDGKTYSSTFGADPTTFNYLLDYSGDNTAIITNLVDGLLENDNYGSLPFVIPKCLRADPFLASKILR